MRTLLLPGLDGTGRLFGPLVAAAPESMQTHVVGYPGDQSLGYDALAQRVLTQITPDAPYGIIAESFSGPIALRVAAAAARPPAWVVLVATFTQPPLAAPLRWLARAASHAMFRLPQPKVALRHLLLGGDAPAELVDETHRAIRSVRPGVLGGRVRQVMTADADDDLRRCPAPVLYIHATRDRMLRRGIPERLRRIRPDITVRELDSPHLVLQRRPAESFEIVEQFVGSII